MSRTSMVSRSGTALDQGLEARLPRTLDRNLEVSEISCQTLQSWLHECPQDVILVDVRSATEYNHSHFAGAVLIPLAQIQQGSGVKQVEALIRRWQTRSKNRHESNRHESNRHSSNRHYRLVVYCAAGVRSHKALCELQAAGITGANLQGGIWAWQAQISDTSPTQSSISTHSPMPLLLDATLKTRFALGHLVPKRPRLWMAASAVAVLGLTSWMGHRVVHNPDYLRPVLAAGVPLNALSQWPVVGEVVQAAELPQITAQDLQGRMALPDQNYLLLDVRSIEEFSTGHIQGAEQILWLDLKTPAGLERLRSRLQGKQLITYCTSGYRSGKAMLTLRQAGIEGIQLQGGILAWQKANLPVVGESGAPQGK
jgi:rhodanese-related sulfurtransferase